MPSGAKKRKAAKKKGTQPNNNNPNPAPAASTQGGDDVKHQEDRRSDVGEASSTASQDQSHQDLLTEAEEEKIENRENASNRPQVEGVKTEGNDVPVEREFKIGDEFRGKYEHDQTERKSYDGGSSGSSSSSSSSSSDDESHGVKSSRAMVDTVPAIAIGEASEAVVESVPPVISDKVSLLSESLEVETSSPSVSKENAEKKGPIEEQVEGSETFYDAESTTPSVVSMVDLKKSGVEETDERLSLSYNAPIATHDNGADLEKDSQVTEPLLVPPPRPVQKTSWKGCCGLFELFTGSDR